MLRKKDLVREAISRDIRENKLVPGSKIPSRNQLMRRFHCSRSVIERAVAELTAEGLLAGRQGQRTYVTGTGGGGAEHQITRLNVIAPYDAKSFRQALSCLLLNSVDIGLPVEMIPEERAESEYEALCAPGALLVYINPGYELLSLMNCLRARNVPQLIINREFDGFDRIYTDTLAGFREAVEFLEKDFAAPLVIVSRKPGIARPYQESRMLSFYRACAEKGILLTEENTFFTSPDELAAEPEILQKIFRHCPVKIAVLSSELAEPVITWAQKSGIAADGSCRILLFEYREHLLSVPNIAMLRQKYDTFYTELQRYLALFPRQSRPEFVSAIPPELVITRK